MGVFQRSFLQNLHKDANVKDVYISVTQGEMEFDQSYPRHGIYMISNHDVNKKIMVNQLSEIFRISRHNLIYNSYTYNFNALNSTLAMKDFQLPFEEVLFGQDVSENLCVDTIENIKQYLGCNGKQGLSSLIEPNNFFRSKYISVQAQFSYKNGIAKQKIIITVRFPTQKISEILDIDPNTLIKSCPDLNEEQITSGIRKFDLKVAQNMRLGQIAKRADDFEQPLPKPILKESKSSVGPWYAFDSQIHQQIQVFENGYLYVMLQFPHEFIPIYHTLKTGHLKSKIIFEGDAKKIYIEGNVQKDEKILIQIEFRKRLKAFEEYPHDPERGQDIISTPIIFVTDSNRYLFFTDSQVTRQPYPDFSMPFNILTFSCLALGYYFLQILGMAVDKYEPNKPEKGSLAQRILRSIFQYL
ncbi:hypothetical protein pb186bvf_013697 [Paramecium bursaria]